ncbi:MAG: hypothetical protein NZT61_05460, partial [Deltaproteobacteria bacterium]|nr:hypothetical protein [Deltaproteobacteria bacterium]
HIIKNPFFCNYPCLLVQSNNLPEGIVASLLNFINGVIPKVSTGYHSDGIQLKNLSSENNFCVKLRLPQDLDARSFITSLLQKLQKSASLDDILYRLVGVGIPVKLDAIATEVNQQLIQSGNTVDTIYIYLMYSPGEHTDRKSE